MKYYINRFANTGPGGLCRQYKAAPQAALGLMMILMLLFAGLLQTASAQNITAGEYFFNADPGAGKGQPVTVNAATTVNSNFTIPTTGLAAGVQQLFVRFKDAQNRWGVAEQRTFYVNATSGVVTPLSAITGAEYFFDTDPGAGRGSAFTIAKNDSLLITQGIPTAGLLKGPHQLFIRFKDSLNRWAIAEQRLFYIDSFPAPATTLSPMIKGEYFYDTDPGVGGGFAITVNKNDSLAFTTGTTTEILTAGTHQLFIRFKDSLNRWGIAEQRTFIIDRTISAPVIIAPVTAGEYFIDTDPGTGRATAITITKADSLNLQVHPASTTAPGVHQLFIRLKDSLNRWSVAEQRTFFVDSAIAKPAVAPIVAAEYFINTDTGAGKGTPIAITRGDTINKVVQITLPANITTGTNYLYIRFKDSTGRWSIAEQRQLPAIVCKPNLGNDTTVTICAGTTTNIQALYAYKGFASAVWSTPRPDSAGTGAYTLIVTSGGGCKDTAVVTVTNFPKPHLGNDTAIIITNNTITKDLTTLYNTTGLATQYSTTTPQSAGAGTYTLTVTDACGFKDTAVIVITLYVPAPIITGYSPSYGGTGTVVTITGKYFTGASVVSFGGTPAASFTVVNDSLITAVTGAGSSGSVLVKTTGGTATKTGFIICNPVTPYVTIATNRASPICANVKVTFTATAGNGGTAPAYQWYKNNITVGTNVATYSDSTLKNSDSVWCVITSNASCLAAPTGKSNVMVYTVTAAATPTVIIAANNASPICNGTKVIFTATAVNGGTPAYQWYKNNVAVGTNAVTYADSLLKNNDSVWCVVTGNAACATAPSAKSNVLKYLVNTSVTASVTITANPAAATCQGTPVTFTAVAVNGGTAPAYQWKKNGVNVGANSTTYTDTLPVNSDSITVILTSSNTCAVQPAVTSNKIKLTVNTKPTLGRDTTVNTCVGTAINIKSLYNTTGLTATWSTARPDSIVAPGIYTLMVASSSGCRDTAVVIVGNYAKPALGRDTTVLTCLGTAANISNIYTTTGLTATWSTTRPDSVKAGTYTITVANGNGCKDTAVVTVAYYAKPNLGNDTTVIVASNTATADITRLYNVTGLSAQYSTATPAAAGPGTYTLIVSNNCGLKDTATIKVIVVSSPPVITSFSPASTYAGGSVTINGKYFTGANLVSFGGTNAAQFTVVNDSLITAVVGTGANGSVLVKTPGGTATKAGFTVCSGVTPGVTITGRQASPICGGTKVTFTATGVNGGKGPRYQWYKNNGKVGTNSSTYADSLLRNHDSVWCVVTSNAACLVATTAKSNVLKYVVNALATPSVSIAADLASPICSGTRVTFTATPVNGGTLPVYQWHKNSAIVGTNSAAYADSLLRTNDSIWCVVTSNAACLAATSAKSNVLTYAVSLYSITSVSIAVSPASNVCAGQPVTFTATPSGPGTAPVYQWKKKGVNVGTNSPTYIDSLPANGDSVYVTLTSSGVCVTTRTAASNGIKLTVNARPNLGKDAAVAACPGTAANITGVYNLKAYTRAVWSTSRPDSVTTPGAYTLIVTNSSGCADTAVVTVNNYTKPNVGNDTAVYICPGSVINLATVYNTTGLTVKWSTSKPNIATAGRYTLIVTNTNGCRDTATVIVASYAKPNLGKDTTVLTCPGTARTITNVYKLTGLTPEWSTTTPDNVATGAYTLKVTNSNGCRDTAVITVSNYARLNVGRDTTISTCPGTAVNLKGVYTLKGLEAVWSTETPDSVTTAGTYTLKVANSNGCKDTAVITISNYPKPNIGKDTAVTVCPGTPVNMQKMYTLKGVTAAWSTARPDSVTTAGAYTLVVSNGNGCKDTAVITINNFAKPALGKDSTVYTCLGTPVNITGLYNLTGLTAAWSTKRPDSIMEAGKYTLIVKNSNSCRDTATVTVVTPAPPAKPNVKVEGGTTFCLGDSLALITNPGAGNLQWYRNSGAIKQATGGTYEVRLSGYYKVQLTTGTNGVCHVMSDSVKVVVTQVVTPTITLVNDTLVSSSPTGNQWFEDGTPVTGATGQKYSPVNIDAYTVQVTSGSCTSAMSLPYIYTAGTNFKKSSKGDITGSAFTAAVVKLYPNPAEYAVHLQISGFTTGVIVTVTDLAGRVIWQQDKMANGTYTLPLDNVASGMYMVTVKDKLIIKTIKLVKAK